MSDDRGNNEKAVELAHERLDLLLEMVETISNVLKMQEARLARLEGR